jgi:hypothetical protein
MSLMQHEGMEYCDSNRLEGLKKAFLQFERTLLPRFVMK